MSTTQKWSGRCWLLHGFNVRDGGKSSVAKLAPFLEAHDIEPKQFRYGWTWILGAKFGSPRVARLLADAMEEGDYIIGHSNGCRIAHLAAQLGAPITAMAYINPALDRDAKLAKQVGHLDVWHSPSEVPTKLARWLPNNSWGDMGAHGYRGKYDQRIRNFDKQHSYPVSSYKHSDVFEADKIKFFGPKIVDELLT